MVPLVLLQLLLRGLPVVVSVTVPPSNEPKVVPPGSARVMEAPGYARAPVEDVVKPKGASLPDDCGDALRYAVAGALLDAEDKPKEQKRREEIDRIKDPMTKMIRGFKHYNEDQAAQRQSSGKEKIIPSWQRNFRK